MSNIEETRSFDHPGSTANDQPAAGSQSGPELPDARLDELPERLRQAFASSGWQELMPVQARTIPYILAGRDMMIQSRTGSGKTGAYLLPILQRIDPAKAVCQSLVLVPTRELALQVEREAETLGGTVGVRCVALYGGVGYGTQLEALHAGAQLVVGTPGRVLDHLLRRSLSLNALKVLVFDEADRMLSMGFYPDMKRVQGYLPDRLIQTAMFSATFPPTVLRLASQFLRNPGFINLSSDHVHVTEVEHTYYVTPGMDKDRSLVHIIEVENPAQVLIFCNTRTRVHYVNVILQRYGYDADELSSDSAQNVRENVLQRLRSGNLRFLVATDVAARGIDIPELSHVILYEPPEDPDDYIHRAGRTGRAGASGVAISLVNVLEEKEIKRIGKRFGIDLQERLLPTEAEVNDLVTQRVIALLEAAMRSRDKLQTERMERFLPLLHSLSENQDEMPLLAMLVDDYYQRTFHASPVGEPHVEKEPRAPAHKGASDRDHNPRRGSSRRRGRG
ncbi:MAG: DEAD/DEAH box helicase [Anaerolineaceae bacterium]|nr:DEAD/DEAH box helicase [Anaerolineaceae bacterium]